MVVPFPRYPYFLIRIKPCWKTASGGLWLTLTALGLVNNLLVLRSLSIDCFMKFPGKKKQGTFSIYYFFNVILINMLSLLDVCDLAMCH